jgi:PhnB protein
LQAHALGESGSQGLAERAALAARFATFNQEGVMASKQKAAPKKKAAPKQNGKAKKVSPVRAGYHTVTAALNQNDAAATIEFCRKAFGAKVVSKMAMPNGKLMHAEVQIGDSMIMLSDAMQEPARVSSLFLYVPDADKTLAKAVKAGATVVMPVMDMFWGDRFGRVADAQGNLYSIATHIEDVSPAELRKRGREAMKQMAAP